jgi:hypothetical protein
MKWDWPPDIQRKKKSRGSSDSRAPELLQVSRILLPGRVLISFSTSEKRLTAARHFTYDANSIVSESLLTCQTDIYRAINQSQATNLVIDTLFAVDV